MAGWLALLGSISAAVVLLLRWHLSDQQVLKRENRKRKRHHEKIFKLEVELHQALAASDTPTVVRIVRELKLHAEEGKPFYDGKSDTDSQEG